MKDRYMTPEGKAAEMAFWQESQREVERTSPETGGMGFVDEEIIEFCDAINEMDHVCTLQSCAGHPRLSTDDPPRPYFTSPQLWLWFRSAEAGRVYARAAELAREDWVNSLTIQIIDGREIVDICFALRPLSLETERDLLEFLRSLATKRERRHYANPMRGVARAANRSKHARDKGPR